jgi:hypothetical protein
MHEVHMASDRITANLFHNAAGKHANKKKIAMMYVYRLNEGGRLTRYDGIIYGALCFHVAETMTTVTSAA